MAGSLASHPGVQPRLLHLARVTGQGYARWDCRGLIAGLLRDRCVQCHRQELSHPDAGRWRCGFIVVPSLPEISEGALGVLKSIFVSWAFRLL